MELRRKRRLICRRDFVLDFAAKGARGGNSRADFHAFDGLYAHYCLGEGPSSFRPTAHGCRVRRDVVGDDLKDAPRVTLSARRPLLLSFCPGCGVDAAQRRIKSALTRGFRPNCLAV